MATAVHYFALEADQFALLDYLGEPNSASLHRWPVTTAKETPLRRHDALAAGQVTIAHASFGPPLLMHRDSRGMNDEGRSGVFNRLNWERLRPTPGEGIIDSNRSPVLLWTPGTITQEAIRQSALGSQADSMSAVSDDYAKWVSRAMSWIRRRGTKVWGLEKSDIRPDLDIRLSTVSTVFALPEALAALESGMYGH